MGTHLAEDAEGHGSRELAARLGPRVGRRAVVGRRALDRAVGRRRRRVPRGHRYEGADPAALAHRPLALAVPRPLRVAQRLNALGSVGPRRPLTARVHEHVDQGADLAQCSLGLGGGHGGACCGEGVRRGRREASPKGPGPSAEASATESAALYPSPCPVGPAGVGLLSRAPCGWLGVVCVAAV